MISTGGPRDKLPWSTGPRPTPARVNLRSRRVIAKRPFPGSRGLLIAGGARVVPGCRRFAVDRGCMNDSCVSLPVGRVTDWAGEIGGHERCVCTFVFGKIYECQVCHFALVTIPSLLSAPSLSVSDPSARWCFREVEGKPSSAMSLLPVPRRVKAHPCHTTHDCSGLPLITISFQPK